ncbi:MAG: NMD3-related protein [Halobacteria archaeon]
MAASRLFCARCGASKSAAELYKGLCAACVPERFPPMSHPPLLRGRRCPRCDSISGGSRSSGRGVEEALRGGFKFAPDLRKAELKLSANSGADPWGGVLRYTLAGLLGSVPVRREGEVPYRLKPEVCENCSRRSGSYYEGVVQVRATGRPLTAEERRRALEAAEQFAVAKVEEEAGGLDLYLDAERETGRLARRLAELLGGTTSASPKVAGRRDGREIYRVSRVVRIRPFDVGEVVRLPGDDGSLLRVEGWKGKGFVGLDLATGRRRTVEAAGAVRAGGEVRRATVVSSTPAEVQILDPVSMATVTLPRPPFLGKIGGEVRVVRTDRGLVLVP